MTSELGKTNNYFVINGFIILYYYYFIMLKYHNIDGILLIGCS